MSINNYPAVDHQLCQVLSQVSRKKKKNKKLILFFDRDAFADNTKYVYLQMVKKPAAGMPLVYMERKRL